MDEEITIKKRKSAGEAFRNMNDTFRIQNWELQTNNKE